jgi:hypothetical protein
MNILYRLFDRMAHIPHDKCLHAIWGQVLALSVFVVGGRGMVALVASFIITTAVAWGKERLDGQGPGRFFDAKDALATMAGGLPIWLLGALQVSLHA